MERLEVNYEILSCLNEGSLGTVLRKQGNSGIAIKKDNELIKINRRLLDRAINDDYQYMQFSYDFQSNELKKLLNAFDILRNKIKLTEFPHKGIYYEDKLIGTVSKFYQGKTLEYINKEDNVYKVLIDILVILLEYERNGISFQDVHPGNYILDSKGVIHPIDLDDPMFTCIKEPNLYGMYYNYWNLLVPELLSDVFSKIDLVNYGYTSLGILDALYDEVPSEYKDEVKKIFFEVEEYEKKKIK